MADNNKILEVKNLRISFKTNSGTVKAVRGIDFTLQKGRTLAIVGESGSGKSVTSKAILGILANNKIVEDGQIIYDGKDLLKVTEEQFTKIRGVKISMIFQDPLSSLNPIMKVGYQLTEAMYLKNKATIKEAKAYLDVVHKFLLESCEDKESVKAFSKYISKVKLNEDYLSEVQNNKEIFVNAFYKALDDQKREVNSTYDVIKAFNEQYCSDINVFDAKKALLEIKKIDTLLKRCKFKLQTKSDDILEVFTSSANFYIESFEESIKLTKEREEILEKYQVQDVHSLPAEVRAKHREVISDKSVHYANLQETVNTLLNHLVELQNRTVSEEMINEFINYYCKQIVDSKTVLTKQETKKRAIELMTEVGINEPEKRFEQYPFEFSGGMRQRIVIAIALSSNPEILICDEPTTALDVTIQAQILELINKLKEEKNLSIIFITHDLGVVANMADDIAVMYAGKIVEYGSVYDVFYDPRHPYTWALLSSMPDLNTSEKLDAIPGTPPNMLLPPKGDAFAARNKYALEIDYEEQPPFYQISDTHYAATWLVDEYAPDVEAPEIVKARIYNSLKNSKDNKPSYNISKNSILNGLGGKK